MNFENFEVGDEVKWNGEVTKIIMKDEKRMACDISNYYIVNWGCLEPVDISNIRLLYAGYEKSNSDQNLFVKTIYKKGTTDGMVECSVRKTDDGYFMSIHSCPYEKIGGLAYVKVKYMVQLARFEEAFRIASTTNL